jgi:hypothetical protein
MTQVWSNYQAVTPLPRATTLPLVIFGALGITVLKCSSVIHFGHELSAGYPAKDLEIESE